MDIYISILYKNVVELPGDQFINYATQIVAPPGDYSRCAIVRTSNLSDSSLVPID